MKKNATKFQHQSNEIIRLLFSKADFSIQFSSQTRIYAVIDKHKSNSYAFGHFRVIVCVNAALLKTHIFNALSKKSVV